MPATKSLVRNGVTRRNLLGIVPSVLGATLARGASRKPVVAAHPWVYAATQPKPDIYPVLDAIFAE